jgi:hypothetical protein
MAVEVVGNTRRFHAAGVSSSGVKMDGWGLRFPVLDELELGLARAGAERRHDSTVEDGGEGRAGHG